MDKFTGVWIPSEVYGFWAGGGIGPTEVLVYLLLEAETCKEGTLVDAERYAARVGCRPGIVRRALHRLADCGLVRQVALGRWATFQVLP